MPRRAKMEDDTGTIHTDESARSNGINEGQLKGYVEAIETELAAVDEIMRNAQKLAQPHIDQIKAIKKEAAENGVAKKPLSAKIRERSLMRKADACRETLSEEQREIFDEITQKLGELPLFQAADEREAA